MNKVTYAEALKGIGIYENKQNRPKEFQDNLNDNARYAVPQRSDIRRYQPEGQHFHRSHAIISVKLRRTP